MVTYSVVPICDSYHLFLCFRWAAVRGRRWLRFLWLHTQWFLSVIVIIYFFVSGGQQSDGGGGLGFCGYILMFLSMIVIVCTLPFSLCLCIKVGNFDSGVYAVGQGDTYEP